jgi:hypothetical protein
MIRSGATWHSHSRAASRCTYIYTGFVQPAGLITRLHVVPNRGATWPGSHAPTPVVRFRIEYVDGDVVIARQRVRLHAGWG